MQPSGMFEVEEKLVKAVFSKSFEKEVVLLSRIHTKLEKTLKLSKAQKDDYSKYSALMLVASSFKSLICSSMLLSLGYLTDSEALIKKSIECILTQAYFYEHQGQAKTWCQENKKPKLNLYDIAISLDKTQESKKIFPTDYENFFANFLYKVGYKQSNRLAHLDFDMVHAEIGLENNDPAKFATTFIIGPKFENEMMRTIMKRLILISSFQLSLLFYFMNNPNDEEMEVLLDELKILILN